MRTFRLLGNYHSRLCTMQQIAYEQNDIQVLSGAESNARYAIKQVQQRCIGVWSKHHRAEDLLQTHRPSQGS